MSTVIKVENLSKQYRLGEVGTGTISHDLNRWWHRIRGKEDPYLRIGESNDRSKKGNSEYVWALQDINFEVQQGEVLGIIGKNGAGKSTLLKILSKVTAPTTGSIKAKGRIASLLEVGTGFHPELTGRENIYLNGAILGMTKREVSAKLDEIVDFAGVERYLDTPVKRYSSGMMVRLGFAVAAHLEPEILIVDEVLAVGDAEFQKKAVGKMQEVSKEGGRTVLFVSHNMGILSKLCQNAILLGRGQIEGIGRINAMIEQYLVNRTQSSNNEGYLVDLSSRKNIHYYIESAYSSKNEQPCKDFGFDDSIELNYVFKLKEKVPNLLFGIALLDKHESRIATIVKPITQLISSEDYKYYGTLVFPPNLLAPGKYSFLLALWLKSGEVYDLVENTCDVNIHETGSNMSDFEGDDYGTIILNCQWK